VDPEEVLQLSQELGQLDDEVAHLYKYSGLWFWVRELVLGVLRLEIQV
jgi:hypothetical protein